MNWIRYEFCAGAKAIRYTVWTRRLNQYSISDFFQLILGSGSCLIDQNLLFTDHTSSMTELYNLMKRRFCWSVQNWLWHDRNIKRWTRRSWKPKSYRRKIKSHKLYYYTQFTMACFKMDKRGFLLLSPGGGFFFFLRSMAFKLPHLLLFLSLKTSRKFQRANATALFVRCK